MAFDYKKEYERYKRYYQSIEPAFQKPANRAYTAIIFSFLVVSLFAWYAIRPTMQTIFTLKREIVDKTDIDKKMENKISALIEAQAAYQEIEPNIPLIEQALPVYSDSPRAVHQLQGLAADADVTMSDLSLAAVPIATSTAVPNTITDFPISLTVTGTYPQITTFVHGILTLRRMMNIDSMLFSPSQSATPSGTQIKLDLKLKVFYLPSS